MMDDVEREAQDRGYHDGRGMKTKSPTRYGYSGHLTDAYNRGWDLGRHDFERANRETTTPEQNPQLDT